MTWDVEGYRDRVLQHVDAVVGRSAGYAVDMGAGDFSFTRALALRGWNAIGVERVPTGPAPMGTTVVRADAERLPFRDGSVALVFAKDMLHHTPDPSRAMADMRRVVAQGGLFVALEPNRYNPMSYVHLTLLGEHDHFTRRRFVALVRAVFPRAQFRMFSAHVYPRSVARLLRRVEALMDALPVLRRFRSYNMAAARRDP